MSYSYLSNQIHLSYLIDANILVYINSQIPWKKEVFMFRNN